MEVHNTEHSDNCASLSQSWFGALDEATAAYAAEYGISRFKSGYRADLIVTESRLLQRQVSYFLQQNLLAIDLSPLISDVMSIADLISIATEQSIRSFNAQSQAA